MIVLYFDGLCEPKNPGGVATYGFVAYDNCKKIKEGYGIVGAGMLGDDVSNNVAEYAAMIRGMECMISSGQRGDLEIRGDSQLTIRQMQGKYAVRANRLFKLHERAEFLKKSFKSVKFTWVPREENEESDLLSRKAFEEFLSKNNQEYEQFYSKCKKHT